MDEEPNEGLHGEIEDFLHREGPTKEAVDRGSLQNTAQNFLDALGNRDLAPMAMEYEKGEGSLKHLEIAAPMLPKPTLDDLAKIITQIPNKDEAKLLLQYAMHGTSSERQDGIEKGFSFTVQQAKPMDIMSGYARGGGIANKRSVPDRQETDKIATRLVLPEFLEGSKETAADVIWKLDAEEETVLQNISQTQTLTIRRNIAKDPKSKEVTAYSYTFQIELLK